jgi:putative alpha-1,2-mannosidase
MGFYPVNPAVGEYLLTTPLFDEVVLNTGGKTITTKTKKTAPDAMYIREVRWNGQLYTKNFISWKMIRSGGTLEIILSATPGNWGSHPAARPFSLTKNTDQ